MTQELDTTDVQGNILSGYRFPHVAHLFGRVTPADAATWRSFLSRIASEITTANWAAKPALTLNVGLSYGAIAALQPEVAKEISGHFPAFFEGMSSRARDLGDGEMFDERWDERDLWLSIHAQDARGIDRRIAELRSYAAGLTLYEETPRGAAIVKDDGNWYEHFGFRDDISYPAVEGAPRFDDADLPGRGKLENGAWLKIATGEFLLGYGNESALDALDGLSANAQRLLRNGSFGVLRRLTQEVGKFRKYLREHGEPNANLEDLAARLMGRTTAGVPLAGSSADLSNFTYDADQRGARCPMGAHVRRANPRKNGRHRLIRRGMAYGAPFRDGDEDTPERGLWFAAYNANIEDQFEFIQKQWMNGPVGTLSDARDPVAGAGPARAMVIEGESRAQRAPVLLLEMPQFVTCLGGQYYFVPGFGGLRFLYGDRMAVRPAFSLIQDLP